MNDEDLAAAIENALEVDETDELALEIERSLEAASSSTLEKKKKRKTPSTTPSVPAEHQPIHPKLLQNLIERWSEDPSVPTHLVRRVAKSRYLQVVNFDVDVLSPYLRAHEKFLLLWMNEATRFPRPEDYTMMNLEFESWNNNQSKPFHSVYASAIRKRQLTMLENREKSARYKATRRTGGHDVILEKFLGMKMMPEFGNVQQTRSASSSSSSSSSSPVR